MVIIHGFIVTSSTGNKKFAHKYKVYPLSFMFMLFLFYSIGNADRRKMKQYKQEYGVHFHTFLYPYTCPALPESHSSSAVLDHKLCPLCPHQLLTLLHKAPTKCIRPCFPALLLPQDHTCPAVPSQMLVHPAEHFTSICLCFFLWFYCEH